MDVYDIYDINMTSTTTSFKSAQVESNLATINNGVACKDCCSKIGTKFAGLYLWFGLANLSAL
jgi:hypothetical protein